MQGELSNVQKRELAQWFNDGLDCDYIVSNWCENRGQFNGRLSSYSSVLKNKFSEPCLSLLLASLGEIGNNCFDHNLGHWQNQQPGCLFVRGAAFAIVADRGRGIKKSLGSVLVDTDPNELLEIAYTQIVTGRAPEKRGNGLKFVTRSLKQCGVNLETHTDNLYFMNKENVGLEFTQKELNNQGVFTYLSWS